MESAAGSKRGRPAAGAAAESEDDDFGPRAPTGAAADAAAAAAAASAAAAVAAAEPAAAASAAAAPPKRRRELRDESVYVSALPSAGAYERSYLHRGVVTHLCVLARDDFVASASADGVLKLWKRSPGGELEFVKAFRAHAGPLAALAASADGARLATLGAADRALKLFDVAAFDCTDFAALDFAPAAAAWLAKPGGGGAPLLAVADRDSAALRIYDGERPGAGALHRLDTLHTAPVRCLAYNAAQHMVISADARGVLEYWSADPDTGFATPAALAALRAGSGGGGGGGGGAPPPADAGAPPLTFRFKTDTALFELAKAKAVPHSLAVSKDGAAFVVTASDRLIRLFSFASGRLLRVYDESLAALRATAAAAPAEEQAALWTPRLAAEAELLDADKAAAAAAAAGAGAGAGAAGAAAAAPPPPSNAVFDDSGHFLLYPTAAGIKIVNTVTNSVSAVLGRFEGERFLGVALYQGTPRVASQYALLKAEVAAAAAGSSYSATLNAKLSAGGSVGGGGGDVPEAEPTLFACAHKRHRLYLFTRREPAAGGGEAGGGGGARDVFNEPPSAADVAAATEVTAAAHRAVLCHEAVLHTTKGDVFLKLLPELAPKAVENFVGHARAGYFDGLTFHRIIKDFMVQTGDPKGDGTGGASIWGREFEDEVDRSVRFDRPGMLAMANAGPCTNGSQFFITTAPCAWLDMKHSIFGRVVRGMDAVHAIENTPTNPKTDRPWEPIKIVSVDVN